MKTKIVYMLVIMIGLGFQLSAQELASNLSDARTSYNTGDLENTRFALREALNSINEAIGSEVLGILPDKLGDMDKVEGSDDVTGTSIGFVGLYISREYKKDSATASFQIVSDSPMLSSINSLLSMSVFFASDPNQKKIKIDGYKALLTREESENGKVSYDVQMPFGNSLMTFETTGIDEEEQVTGILDEVPVSEIAETVK